MNSLSEDNQIQLQKYLRFFRQKRDGLQRTLQDDFRDAKADKSDEDVFTKDDVMDFVDSISGKTRSTVGFEVSNIVNMGALLVTQLLESAELKGLQLELDTSAIENQRLLEAIEQMNLSGVVKSKGRGELTSFRDEAKARQQESKVMKDETDRLEASNRTLQERFTTLQNDSTRLQREKNTLASEVAELRKKLDDYERNESSSRAAIGKSSEDSSSQVLRLQRQLEEAREEANKKVQDTTQFRQMREMMQSQSTKLRDLRKRLQRYEPDDAKDDDVN